MEDFKDVMLSEPPQRYNNAPAATSVSNALSLESYKGILLCDRPADTRANRGRSEMAPFLPPGNTDMDRGNGNLGLQPSIEARSKLQLTRAGRLEGQRAPKNPALSRHRKWLMSFANEVKKMKTSKDDEDIRESMRKNALREREASKRRGAGTLVGGPSPNDSTAAEVEAARPAEEAPAASKAAASTAKKAASKKPTKSKPKWAMTEEEAEDAEFAEARDLVDFAADLDYDGFMKDFEVQEALAIMRDRVKEIAAEKGIDLEAERARRAAEADDDTCSVITTSTTTGEPRRRPKQRTVAKDTKTSGDDERLDDRPLWDDSTNTAIRKALQGDALKLAERVLQSSDALRKVHSKMSMAKLLQDVAMEVNAGSARQVTMPAESTIVAPRIAIVSAEATGNGGAQQPQKRVLTDLRQSKTHVQNLPYLYRCPSI